MGKYEAATAGLGWWERLRLLEPAMVRGIVGTVVAVFLLWGVDLTPWGDRVTGSWELIFAALPLVQAWWTRTVVSPSNGSAMADG